MVTEQLLSSSPRFLLLGGICAAILNFLPVHHYTLFNNSRHAILVAGGSNFKNTAQISAPNVT